jgi:hypothetical protein
MIDSEFSACPLWYEGEQRLSASIMLQQRPALS